MYKIVVFLVLIFIASISDAITKNNLVFETDTVNLKEVSVSVVVPLTNNKVTDFYRNNAFSTMDNINRRLEGLMLIKRGAYALEPQMNGFSGGQMNVTIDGMKMFGACTDKMDPITSYIEPSNLQSIKLKSGTNCSENGCNIGGSMDMTLLEPEVKNANHSSSIAFGTESVNNSKNTLFLLGLKKANWLWVADGVYRKTENYRDGNGVVIPFSQFEKTNLHSALKYVPNAVNSLKADVLYDIASNVGYPALPMDVSLARATLFALEYQRKSVTQLKAKVYYNQVLHIMDDSQRDSLYMLKNKPVGKSDSVYMRMDMPGISSALGAYVQVQIPWGEQHQLTVKADSYSNYSLAEMTMHMRYAGFAQEKPMYMQTWPAMVRTVSGIYAENVTSLSPKLLLNANVRIDYNVDELQSEYGPNQFSIFNYSVDNQKNTFVKSVNLLAQYRFNTISSLVATVGHSERLPTIGERLGFYLFNAYDGYDYIGNPNIRPEQSNFLKLNLQLSTPVFKANISPSISFLSDYIMGVTNDQIAPMNFTARGIRMYTNIPRAKLFSTDFQLFYNPVEYITFFCLTKYTFGELYSGEAMPMIAPLKNVLAFQYQQNGLQLKLENESSLAQQRINLQFGEKVTPAFSVVNIKTAYEFTYSKLIFNASVGMSNLFNKVYFEHLDFGRINRPGRSVELYLKMSY